MSNSATAPTSTTASSTNSASELPTSEVTVPGRTPIEIVACGALAGHVREIAARRGWPVVVRPLPAALHNRPEKISDQAERLLRTPHAPGSRTVLGYADCGSYGALDKLSARTGADRLPGLHCYDLYAGPQAIEAIFAEQPGTYL